MRSNKSLYCNILDLSSALFIKEGHVFSGFFLIYTAQSRCQSGSEALEAAKTRSGNGFSEARLESAGLPGPGLVVIAEDAAKRLHDLAERDEAGDRIHDRREKIPPFAGRRDESAAEPG